MGLLDEICPQQLLTSTVALTLIWLIFKWWRENRKLPPGPWGVPGLGYFPFIKTTHEDFLKLSKVYGNVFSFRTVGGKLMIVLNSARVIRDVLVNRADEFIGRPTSNNTVEWVSKGLGITQEEGKPWSEQRRFFLQTVKNFGFGKMEMEYMIHDEIRLMIEALRKPGSNVHEELAYTASCIISHVCFGKKFVKDETFVRNLERIGIFVSMFTGNLHMLLGLPFDIATRLPNGQNYYENREQYGSFISKVIDEIELNYDPSHSKCYVEAYLQQRNAELKKGIPDGGTFTMNRLKAITANLYLEGTESVSSTTTSLLLELSKNPDTQKNIQEELDNVVGRERMPSWADRQNLPYLEAAIQELYRKAAVFLVTTMYSNFKETTIEGYRIPKRSVIFANLWSIHRDPIIYPDPEKFNPRRFLSEEGKKIKLEGPYPFGLGKRSCIGESLAQMEVFLIISCIMQSFNLPPANESHELRLIPRHLN